MFEDDYLSLENASKLLRRPKRELRELVRGGRMPAVRRDARWYIHRRDMTAFLSAGDAVSRAVATADGRTKQGTAVSVAMPRDEILAFIGLLRDRDEQLALLQDERVRLTGQVGYLQAQLADRDARLAALESAAANTPRQLPAHMSSGSHDAHVDQSARAEGETPPRVAASAAESNGRLEAPSEVTSGPETDRVARDTKAPSGMNQQPAPSSMPTQTAITEASGAPQVDPPQPDDPHSAAAIPRPGDRLQGALARSRAAVQSLRKSIRRHL